MPTLSAVIPTLGRSTLPDAIRSARCQGVDTEVVVVFDLVERPSLMELADGADVVLFTGGVGGAAARNAGVRAARGDWIGFLDDDDVWVPEKTTIQVRAAEATGADVVASRVRQTFVDDVSSADFESPRRLYQHGSVARYLFWRRRAGHGRASLYTSTLLVRRAIAVHIPWDVTLRRHQDWDWIVRVVDGHGRRLVQVPQVCADIATGTPGSISRSSDWESSLMWAGRALRHASPAAYVDFVAAQPLRYALSAHSVAGAWRCLVTIASAGRAPSVSSLVVGLAGLLPQGMFARVYRAVR